MSGRPGPEVAYPSVVQSVVHESSEAVYHTLMGADNVIETKYSASSQTPNLATFDFMSPGAQMILDRRVILQAKVVYSYNNVGAPLTHLPLVPVDFPLMSAIQTITVTVNTLSLTEEPQVLKKVFARTALTKDQKRRLLTSTPVFPDNDFTLANMEARYHNNPHARPTLHGNDLPSRYQFPCIVKDATNVRTVEYDFQEPLYCPLIFSFIENIGVANIDKISIKINYVSDPVNVMFKKVSTLGAVGSLATAETAYNNSAAMATFVFNDLSNAPQALICRWIRSSTPIPDIQRLEGYNIIKKYRLGPLVVSADQPKSVEIFDETRLNCVPDMLYFFVRNSAVPTVTALDSYFPITKLSIRAGDKDAGATPRQLWQMTVDNGVDVTWNEWLNGGQTIIAVKMGKDIGGFISGSKGAFNIFATVTTTVNVGADCTPSLTMLACEPSTLTLSYGSASQEIGYYQPEAEAKYGANDIQALDEKDFVGAGGKLGFRTRRRMRRGFHLAPGAAVGYSEGATTPINSAIRKSKGGRMNVMV
jgi:hypothetical protein